MPLGATWVNSNLEAWAVKGAIQWVNIAITAWHLLKKQRTSSWIKAAHASRPVGGVDSSLRMDFRSKMVKRRLVGWE